MSIPHNSDFHHGLLDAVPVETANTEPESTAPTQETETRQTELERLKALVDRLHFGDGWRGLA